MSKKRNKNSRKKQLKDRRLRKITVKKNSKMSDNILETLGYKVTSKPVDDSDIRKLPEDIQDQIEDIYGRIFTMPSSTVDELKSLIPIYPHIPLLYNYLYVAYSYIGENEKAIKIMKENYKINPNYLFAQLNYVEYYLKQGNLGVVDEVFNDKLDLKLLYPERNTFHDTEVISFHGVIGVYYLMKGQYNDAKIFLEILEMVSSNHQYTKRLRKMLLNRSNFTS